MKNKLNLLVVMVLTITTILLGQIMPVHAATETRTTVSRSYVDFWEYNNRPGVFRVEGENVSQDVRLGDIVSYATSQPYYRGLAPGEKVKSVSVMSGTIGNVTQKRYTDSQYDEFNNKDWTDFRDEQRYVPTNTIVNPGSVSGASSSRPSVSVRIGTKLTNRDDAYKLPNGGRPGSTGGYRVYATYVLEWEIETADKPAADPKVTVQHFNETSGTKLASDNIYTAKKGQSVSESKRTFSNMTYTNSKVSDDGGKTWKMESSNSTRNVTIDKDTIIRL